jgi:MFS transporter, MHS family, citrate/tricarballylate:H+ symporter
LQVVRSQDLDGEVKESTLTGPPDHVHLARRHIAAVLLGNGLEFYDFLAYSFFALQIGRAFFPSRNPLASLLLSLATFGAGFLTRPVGALIIGRYADRVGRRPAMMLTFLLMGISILGVALTPAYSSIGLAAPILVVFWRLLQGFALGGELGPTTAFLIEAAPPTRRALYGSMQYATQGVAVLAAGLVGVALAAMFDAVTLDRWGWRCAFLIGVAVVPVGLMIRRTLPETLHASAPLLEAPVPAGTSYLRPIVFGLCLITAATVNNYVRTYLTTYAVATLGMSARVAFVTTTIHGVTLIIAVMIGGWLGDRIGRKPVMLTFGALLALATLPIMIAMTQIRTPASLYFGMVLMTALAGLSGAPALTAISESLPRHVRAGAIGTMYAVAVSVFGGTTQFIVAWLIGKTGSELVPGWYGTAAALVGLAGAIALRETRPVNMHVAARTSR